MIAKRIFDLFFVIPGLLLLSPAFLIISIRIKKDSDGPVFFRQERVGLNGKRFQVLKFRTMVENAEEIGPKITTSCDSRITKSGLWLRKYKADELPQLINVLKGEMSLVGPRPEVPEYVALHPEKERKEILSVLPGVTDKASIEFRNENDLLSGSTDLVKDYREKVLPIKLSYYMQYVKERSLKGDFLLILRTIAVII